MIIKEPVINVPYMLIKQDWARDVTSAGIRDWCAGDGKYNRKWTFPCVSPHEYGMFFCFRAREALRQCLPDELKDPTFAACLKDDNTTKHWLQQLMQNLETVTPGQIQTMVPHH